MLTKVVDDRTPTSISSPRMYNEKLENSCQRKKLIHVTYGPHFPAFFYLIVQCICKEIALFHSQLIGHSRVRND